MSLLLELPRRSPPKANSRLNAEHPLAALIRDSGAANLWGSIAAQDIGPAIGPWTPNGTTTGAIAKKGWKGVSGNGTTGYFNRAISIPTNTLRHVLFCIFAYDATMQGVLYSLGSNTVGAAAYAGFNMTSGPLRADYRALDDGVAHLATGPTLVAGGIYACAFEITSLTATSNFLHVNGVKYAASGSALPGIASPLVHESVLALRRNAASLFCTSKVFFTARALLNSGDDYSALLTEWTQNPLDLFEPRRIWVPVSAAGGGATNLVVADALHGHAADNLVLTSEHLLTVADALHGHAADNPTLTTDSVLAVADSSHSHTADALIFTVQSVLAIQEALHSHTADNIVLGVTDTTNLAIADATHGHAADALILTVQSVLTIQESLHVHSVDNLVLGTTGAANLTIADAIHSHTVDSLSLTAQSVLTIQEALHAHTADSLLLETTGQVTLLIADAVHGHFVDSISLSSTHVLAISDAIHTHAADNINLSYELSLLIADSLHSHYADNLIVSGEPVLAIDDALHLHYADALTLSTATWLVIQEAMHAHHSDNVILTFGGIGTSALVTGAILVDRKFVTSIVNAQIIGRLFDRLDS